MNPGIVGRRAPVACPPSLPPRQNQVRAPIIARPVIEQQSFVAPAAYPSTNSSNQNQAGTSTRTRPVVEQPNYSSPNAAYPATLSFDQHQASSPTGARPAIEQQSYTLLNQVSEPERRDRSDFFATVLNPTKDAPAPAREDTFRFRSPSGQPPREQLVAVERDRAALAAREQADAATSRNMPVVMADQNRDAALSAENYSRVRRGLQVEQHIQAKINATLAMEAERERAAAVSAEREEVDRASEVEQRAQAQRDAIERKRAELTAPEQACALFSSNTPVVTADANCSAATPAARKIIERVSEAEQSAQAQRDAIERNKIALAVRALARNTPWKPPPVRADADSAVAASAEHDDSSWGSRLEQQIRAEVAVTAAERNTATRLSAAHEDMERFFEAGQRVRAQWDAIKRNSTASSNPPILGTGLNTAAATLVARDEEHADARDSLLSSPVTARERAPFFQPLNRSPSIPIIAPTAPGQRSTTDQQGPRAARSRAELLQIRYGDPEYHELTIEERNERTKAMQSGYYQKRKKAKSSK